MMVVQIAEMTAAAVVAESSNKDQESKMKDMELDLQDSQGCVETLKQQVLGVSNFNVQLSGACVSLKTWKRLPLRRLQRTRKR